MENLREINANKANKEKTGARVDALAPELLALADRICDHPEVGFEEQLASAWLCDFLSAHGFAVERGVAGLETAFRASYAHGQGGPSIGLLCEYDALAGIGHGCGHHLQGPCVCGAAVAVKDTLAAANEPYRLVVYGTPAEETAGGKVLMLERGCFQDIDVALMMHASGSGTAVDDKTLAMSAFEVTFTGKSAHAAIAPHAGRSALDALLLSFSGVEFLREHVPSDVRMHYTIPCDTGPVNVVHAEAVGAFALRSYDRAALDAVIERFEKIIHGASLMTETTYAIRKKGSYDNTICVHRLRELLMENARAVGAPDIRGPRDKTGSTDFGNVTYRIPGACMRVASDGPVPAPGHSKEAAAQGKSDENHAALIYGAKILAASACDLIADPWILEEIRAEFRAAKGGDR